MNATDPDEQSGSGSGVSRLDRAIVVALGAAGCALSYDSLQQMAVAVHVRGWLTYLFPLVIDGFIAYGVRALLVLREAPLRARLYLWSLFGTATATSIWANAIHAVRLNEELAPADGLQLGNKVVAVLSTIAPLALAGATHLYILIARESTTGTRKKTPAVTPGRDKDTDRPDTVPDNRALSEQRPAVPVGGRSPRLSAGQRQRPAVTSAAPVTAAGTARRTPPAVTVPDRTVAALPAGGAVTVPDKSAAVTVPDSTTADTVRSSGRSSLTAAEGGAAGQPVTSGPSGQDNGRTTGQSVGHRPGGQSDPDRNLSRTAAPDNRPDLSGGQPPASGQSSAGGQSVPARQRPGRDPDTEALLDIARKAVREEGKLTRAVVAQAIRGQQIPLSNDRLTELVVQLRPQPGQPDPGQHRP